MHVVFPVTCSIRIGAFKGVRIGPLCHDQRQAEDPACPHLFEIARRLTAYGLSRAMMGSFWLECARIGCVLDAVGSLDVATHGLNQQMTENCHVTI